MKTWTKEEIELLKNNYKFHTPKELAGQLNKSLSSVHHKAHNLNLTKVKINWTKEEDEILKQNYFLKPSEEISQILHRTDKAIHSRAEKLKLSIVNKWKPEEIKILQDFYPSKGPAFCGRFLKRKPYLVGLKAKSLGLKFTNRRHVPSDYWSNLEVNILSKSKRRIENAIKTRRKRGKKVGAITNLIELLGCSAKEYIVHLESKFTKNMNWGLFIKAKIVIDHIKPINSFNLSDPEEFKICFNHKNTQPLWASNKVARENGEFILQGNVEKWHKHTEPKPISDTPSLQSEGHPQFLKSLKSPCGPP